MIRTLILPILYTDENSKYTTREEKKMYALRSFSQLV